MDLPIDMTTLLAFVLSILILHFSIKIFWIYRHFPPGPIPLPLLGNVLDLAGGNIVKSLLKIREKYGDVFTIHLGSRPIVVVTGYSAVKEIYMDRGDDFLNRGDIATFDTFHHNDGFLFTNDMNRWRELRRFSLSTMRDLAMGKKSIEDRIIEECQCLVTELKKTKGLYFDLQPLVSKFAFNVLFSIMFGHRIDYDDSELVDLENYIADTFQIINSPLGQMFEIFPTIMRLLPGKHQRMFSNMRNFLQYVEKRVEKNKETLDPNNPRDYVDVFLIKMEKEKNEPNTEYTMRNLVICIKQIFFAGVKTMSATISYALQILMKNPDVLEKICEEIDNIIGRERSPKMQDKNQMPFTDAAIHEMQRFINLLPLGVARKTTRDVEFKGYYLPKNTNVYPMITTVLHDPACFPYPNEFNPKNFLDENGKFKKNDGYMPLSAGKRNCMGEALAKMELFHILITILRNFTLKPEIPVEELDLKPDASGISNVPKLSKVSFIAR